MANTNIGFVRGDTEYLKTVPVADGQLLWNTETGEEYADVGLNRTVVGVTDRHLVYVQDGNIWDHTLDVEGQLQVDGGLAPDGTQYKTSVYMDVPASGEGYIYYKSDNRLSEVNPSGYQVLVCAYDGNKEFIPPRRAGTDVGFPCVFPENAKYFRISMAKNWLDSTWRTYGIFNRRLGNANEFNEVWKPPVLAISGIKDLSNPIKVSQLANDLDFAPYYGDTKPIVACWGDSLTDGAGSSGGGDYPAQLHELLYEGGNYIYCSNYGVGGEGSYGIALRMGANVMYADPFTIPADSSVVVEGIHLKEINGNNVSTLLRGGTVQPPGMSHFRINPVVIGGVAGTLSRPTASDPPTYTFQRNTNGDTVTLTRPAVVKTHGYLDDLDDITIIWAGTNDVQSWKGVPYIINNINHMIDTIHNSHYMVIGLTSKAYHDDIEAKNKALLGEYGNKFLDVRNYMLQYGLEDAGITPTEQDKADIASGEIPISLRSDSVHLNNKGYRIIAEQVYKHGQYLGYWK